MTKLYLLYTQQHFTRYLGMKLGHLWPRDGWYQKIPGTVKYHAEVMAIPKSIKMI